MLNYVFFSVVQEKYWRTTQLGEFYERCLMDGGVDEYEESDRQRVVMSQQESLMKQFAVSIALM